MEKMRSVPVERPADADTQSTLKYEVSVIHPVEVIERESRKNELRTKRQLMAATFGAALPMRLMMQESILSEFHRLPGLPSSYAGLESFSGRDEKVELCDVFSLDEDVPDPPQIDVHEVMEKRLGIQTKRLF